MTSFWRQALVVGKKDLTLEGRSREAIAIATPFALVALLIFPLALDNDRATLRSVGFGGFWTVIVVFGLLVAGRQTAVDGPAQRDLLALSGLDPAAGFTGRVMASTVLVFILQVVAGLITVVFYDLDPVQRWALWPVLALLVALALAQLGALAAAITWGLKTRTVLAPLLVVPLAIPVVIAGSAGTSSLISGSSILAAIVILMIVNLVLGVVGVLTASTLEEFGR